MAKKLDRVLVVDVEATCWEGQPPRGEMSEIIEIGYAVLDVPSRTLRQNETILVKPQRSKVSVFCTQLTTLTQEEVDQGVPFEQACLFLEREMGAKSVTWASYGDYDRKQFLRQCQAFGVSYPFSDTHLNVKNLFALTYGLPHEVGMAEALKVMGRDLEGTHHRAWDDARNVAHILAHLLGPRG
jgi:inhibitor of KinA sporulation pathway (predicted exonuclease)